MQVRSSTRVNDQVIYIPLGQYTVPSVWRKEMAGAIDGPATPIFWNVEKAD
jgi:peptide/nickel transport system substrate-binding protein